MDSTSLHDPWSGIARKLIEEFPCVTSAETPIANMKIWIGASKSDPALAEHSVRLGNELRRLGATVLSTDGIPFDSELTTYRLKEADVIIMLAATPGVSVRALEICHRSDNGNDPTRDKMHVYMPQEYQNGFICSRLKHYRARMEFRAESAFKDPSSGEIFHITLHTILNERMVREKQEALKRSEFRPQIGLVTALDTEFKAMKCMLGDETRSSFELRPGKPHQEYEHATLRSDHGGEHAVALMLAGKGNNKAAIAANELIDTYPTVEVVFMVGVAGGVPDLENAANHVRLGDIVVCNDYGVLQTDMVKYTKDGIEHHHEPRPPSAPWIARIRNFVARMPKHPRYWDYLDQVLAAREISRPKVDVLRDSPWLTDVKTPRHPRDPSRTKDRPRLHQGPIASSNAVIKDAAVRDRLKKELGVLAVEMESSGIAEATWQTGKGYFVIRGICDYANPDKNKVWQPYAAAAAAAFTRDFIETMPVEPARP